MPEIEPQQRKGRRMLLFLLVLFTLPILAVVTMYWLDYQPGGASHGDLLTPPKALQPSPASDLQGRNFDDAQWKKKWHLVVIANGACAEDCQQRVYLVRQIHITLNKEMERVQRVLIVSNSTGNNELANLQKSYPDLVILAGSEATALAQQFDLDQSGASDGHVYVVDPLGNIMMTYPPGFDPKGMQKDMAKLLKYSWVG